MGIVLLDMTGVVEALSKSFFAGAAGISVGIILL
jgi:hypothetical protein